MQISIHKMNELQEYIAQHKDYPQHFIVNINGV